VARSAGAPRALRRPLIVAAVLAFGTAALACAAVAAEPIPIEAVWSERAPLPRPNSEIAVAELDGKIYVIGGYPSTRRYVDAVQVYDTQTDSWEIGVSLPQPMHHTMAASANGLLYVIGGEVSSSGFADRGIFLDSVYAFDPASGTWSSRASMPTARSGGGAAVVGGKIYVAGGGPPAGPPRPATTSRSTTRPRIAGRRCRTCRPSATTWRSSAWAARSTSSAGASAAVSAAR
jgi:hypothetical protein